MTAPLLPRRTLLVGALVAIPATARADAPIRVAAVDAMSGPLGHSGLDTTRGEQVAADEINAAGGIRAMGGRTLQIIRYDTAGQAAIGQAAAERAVAEGAVAILGTTHSAVTMATTAAAERAGIPHIVTGSATPEITARGYRCTFRVMTTSDIVFDSLMPSLQAMFQARGLSLASFVTAHEDSGFGRFATARHRSVAEKAGVSYASVAFPSGAAAMSAVASQLKAVGAQVIHVAGYASDAVTLVRALKESGVDSALVIPSVGVTDAAFMQAIGERDAEGFAGLQYFNPNMRPAGNPDGPRRFQDAYARQFGEPGLLGALGYTAVRTLAKALEDAGSTEPGPLRDALAAVELRPEDGHILPSSMVKFDAAGQNCFANAPQAQVIRGRLELVWPLDHATAKPELPMPTWQEKAHGP